MSTSKLHILIYYYYTNEVWKQQEATSEAIDIDQEFQVAAAAGSYTVRSGSVYQLCGYPLSLSLSQNYRKNQDKERTLLMARESQHFFFHQLLLLLAVGILFLSGQEVHATDGAASTSQLSKSTGPPAFCLQDPNDGSCLAGAVYKRCGIDTLW